MQHILYIIVALVLGFYNDRRLFKLKNVNVVMVRELGRGRYRGVNLPMELMEEVDRIVDINRFGFKTSAEFVRSAVREKINFYLPNIEYNE